MFMTGLIFKYDENGFDVNKIFKSQKLSPTSSTEELQNIINAFNNSKLSAEAFSESMNGIDNAMLSYLKTCKNGEAYTKGFENHVKTANKSIGLMGIKSKATAILVGTLNSVLSAGISILAGYIISGVVKFFDELIETQEELAEAAQEAQAKIDELSSSLERNRNLVKDAGTRYAELAQGVNSFNGQNVNLSNEEYEEFLNLSNQLAEAFPELVKGATESGGAILDLSGSTDSIIASLNELIRIEQLVNSQKTAESLPSVIKNAQSEVKEYKEEISKLQEQQRLLNDLMSNDMVDKKISEVSNSLGQTIFRVDVLGEFDSFKREDMKKQLLGIFGDGSSFNGVHNINEVINGEANKIGEQFLISVDEDKFGDFEKYFYDNMGVFDDIANTISTKISRFNVDIDKTFSSILPTINTALQSNSDFSILGADIQTAIQSIVSNLNLDGIVDVEAYIQKNIIGLFDDENLSEDLQLKLLNLFTIDRTSISDNDYVALFNNVISQIKTYIEENNIDIELPLSIDFLIADETEMEQRLQNRINEVAYNDFTGQQNVSDYMREKGIDTAEEKNLFLEITKDANNALEMIQLFEEHLASLKGDNKFKLFTEENNAAMDAFQEKVAKANEYIQMINDGSISEVNIIDVVQEMDLDPNKIDLLSDSYEGLKQQLEEIANIEFNNISDKLAGLLETGEIDQETYDQLIDAITLVKLSYKQTYDGMESLSGGMTDLQSGFNALTDAEREHTETGKISYETVQALSSAYPELEQELMSYLSGMTDVEIILANLNEAYNADLMNYKTYYAEKHKNDIDFYNRILERIPQNVKDRFAEYDADLKNYKSLAEAKLQIEKNLADEIYKKKLGNSVKTYEKPWVNENYMYNESDPETLRRMSEEEAEELSSALDKGVELTIELPKLTYTGSNDGNGSDTEKINEIDWAANSIDNLTNKINGLNSAIENEPNFKKQLDLINDLKDAQEDLLTLRGNAVTEYSDRYKDSLGELKPSELTQYKPLIESNTALSLEMFEGENRQEVFERVSAAQKAWQAYQQALIEYEAQVGAVADTQDQKYETKMERIQGRIDRHENNAQGIRNKIDLQTAKNGYADKQTYQDLIDENDKTLEDYDDKLELAKKKRDKALKKHGKNSDEYVNADKNVQEVKNSISSLKQEQIELNREVLRYPVHQLEIEKELLEEQLELVQKKKEDVSDSISAASELVQGQIDYYQDLKEATQDSYDSQIKDIQKQKDVLTETNDELKQQISLEKARYNLDRAKNQKTVKILRDGEFVYEADVDAIMDAQEALEQEQYNMTVSSFDKQIKNLEDEKQEALDGIDKQIESLTTYKEQIDNIVSGYEQVLRLQTLISTFGHDAPQRVLNGDLSIVQEMGNEYINTASTEKTLQEGIDLYADEIESVEKYALAWTGSKTTIETAKQQIEDIVKDTEEELKAIGVRNDATKSVATEWNTTQLGVIGELGLIENGQTVAKDNEATILKERLETLKTFATEAKGYLSEVSSALASAEQLKAEFNNKNNNKKFLQTGVGAAFLLGSNLKFHDGMESGYVGEKESKDTFKQITLTKLQPDEVPAVLQVGESVLTKLQQTNVLDNMRTAFYAGVKLPDFNNIQKANNITTAPSITLNGDIVLQGVNNTTEFAKKIKSEFLTKLSQELYK